MSVRFLLCLPSHPCCLLLPRPPPGISPALLRPVQCIPESREGRAFAVVYLAANPLHVHMGPDDPTAGHTITLSLPASGRSDALAPSLPQSRGAGGRSGCKSSRSLEPSSVGDMPGCDPWKASGLPVLPALEPRRPSSSLRSSSRSTLSSSPDAGLHRPPVYREGMVFYPTTGGPSAGQAGLPHLL
jgi:hypothetical protein